MDTSGNIFAGDDEFRPDHVIASALNEPHEFMYNMIGGERVSQLVLDWLFMGKEEISFLVLDVTTRWLSPDAKRKHEVAAKAHEALRGLASCRDLSAEPFRVRWFGYYGGGVVATLDHCIILENVEKDACPEILEAILHAVHEEPIALWGSREDGLWHVAHGKAPRRLADCDALMRILECWVGLRNENSPSIYPPESRWKLRRVECSPGSWIGGLGWTKKLEGAYIARWNETHSKAGRTEGAP